MASERRGALQAGPSPPAESCRRGGRPGRSRPRGPAKRWGGGDVVQAAGAVRPGPASPRLTSPHLSPRFGSLRRRRWRRRLLLPAGLLLRSGAQTRRGRQQQRRRQQQRSGPRERRRGRWRAHGGRARW